MIGKVFWAIVIGFLTGVFVACVFHPGSVAAFAVVGVGFLFAVSTLVLRTPLAGVLAAVALFAGGIGVLRMQQAVLIQDPLLSAHLGEHLQLEGNVVAEPDIRDSSVRLAVRADKLVFGGATSSIAAGVLVVAPAHAQVRYGDRIVASGVLQAPKAFDSGAGRQFDYPSYLAAQGILYQLAPASVSSIARGGDPLKVAALDIKEAFETGLAQVLPEPEAGFAAGIDVGDKRSLGKELTADFQKSGLIAMVVLSGYNITIVINAFYWLLARIPFVRSIRFAPLIASVAVIIFFVLIAGGASSAVRAGAMALVAAYARFSRRTFLAGRALGVAAAAIVAWNPYVLAFDPGFQLSALATLGLIILSPLFIERLSFVPSSYGLREIAATTAGAQIAVLPFLLYQTGMLSIYALVANIITLPLVPYAMFLALVAGVVGFFFGPIATIVALPAYLTLGYIINVASLAASLPFAGVGIPAFSAWMLLPMYFELGAAVFYFQKNNGRTNQSGRSD